MIATAFATWWASLEVLSPYRPGLRGSSRFSRSRLRRSWPGRSRPWYTSRPTADGCAGWLAWPYWQLSARVAIEVVQERTLVGGATVFDHVTGVDRFRYTLGERIVALPLLDDPRYFHLHAIGVPTDSGNPEPCQDR